MIAISVGGQPARQQAARLGGDALGVARVERARIELERRHVVERAAGIEVGALLRASPCPRYRRATAVCRAQRIGGDAEVLEPCAATAGDARQLAVVRRARRERHDLLVHAVLLLEHHARRVARRSSRSNIVEPSVASTCGPPVTTGPSCCGSPASTATFARASAIKQQRIRRLRRLVDDDAVEHAIAEQRVIAADAGREHDVGAIDDRALARCAISRAASRSSARASFHSSRCGASAAPRLRRRRTLACASRARGRATRARARRAVGVDLGVERQRRERRRDARRMTEPHRADAGVREPDAEVVDGGVRRRRAQHALAARTRWRTTSTSVRVLPVPGGPWISAMSPLRSAARRPRAACRRARRRAAST